MAKLEPALDSGNTLLGQSSVIVELSADSIQSAVSRIAYTLLHLAKLVNGPDI